MFAVIETGGKQYRVKPGDVIEVERFATGDESVPRDVEFDRVLLVGDGDTVHFGAPVVEGALVRASLLGDAKGPKIRVFKTKKRKGYRRTRGHRQHLQRVKIGAIQVA
ncbi:MAG TPA: 50S ribosomal protein L21 [Thermoanaerobaculia bacterium]|jgi:large subunit ribosomal protein L21|nr:50S ribosomal protein L21 [Thermoanaerobaculia bacterium]